MTRLAVHLGIAALLTIATQLGGAAWLLSRLSRRPILSFGTLYLAFAVAAAAAAPLLGRVAVACWRDGPLQVQSWVYCAANRVYVAPELLAALEDAAAAVAAAHPGSKTLLLDGSFPFLDGFPMLPHLSHDDGEKADLAFHYRRGDAYAPGATRSPIGYFAFEAGTTQCPQRWLTLRWDLRALQPLWPDRPLEPSRTKRLLEALAADPRIGKILLEPHLKQSLGVQSPKIRFQGCRAARHDDHIHVQL